MEKKIKSAIISGGTGYIGSYLVDALLGDGVKVAVITRKKANMPARWHGSVRVVEADIINTSLKIPEGYDVFFHCAGSIEGKTSFEQVNVLGTKNVLHACRSNNDLKRFVHLSSVGVMGCVKPGEYDEFDSCNPGNDYEVSKYQAELLVTEASCYFPVTILRPSIVFGPGKPPDRDSFFALVKSIKSRQFRLLGDNNSFYNIVFVQDVVRALILLATARNDAVAEKIFIINDPLSWPIFCTTVTNLLRKKEVRRLPKLIAFPIALVGSVLQRCGVFFPLTLTRYRALTSGCLFVSKKIKSELDFVPEYGVLEGIKKTISSYSESL